MISLSLGLAVTLAATPGTERLHEQGGAAAFDIAQQGGDIERPLDEVTGAGEFGKVGSSCTIAAGDIEMAFAIAEHGAELEAGGDGELRSDGAASDAFIQAMAVAVAFDIARLAEA